MRMRIRIDLIHPDYQMRDLISQLLQQAENKQKTKKRPTAAQAFAGGFAQGVSSGIQQAAQLSLQDRLNKQKEFEDFTKGLPQLINFQKVAHLP